MVKYFPENPDAWSETLTPPEGTWYGGISNCHVELDLVYKRVGEASIRCVYDAHDPWNPTATIHLFVFNEPVDLTPFESIEFIHGLQEKVVSDGNEYPAFTGYCEIEIGFYSEEREVITYAICKKYGVVPGQWEAKSFKLREMEVPWWSEKKDIEEILKSINYIMIYSYIDDAVASKAVGQSSWIDYIHFTAPEVKLIVKSEPTGKHFTIDGVGFVTPQRFTCSPGEKYIINMEPAGFLYWENGDTNHIREVVMPDHDLTIIAYYEEAEVVRRNKLIAGIVVTGALSILGYMFYSYYLKRG